MTVPASANATSMFYCVQDVAGQLPSNPVFKEFPFTGGVPTLQRDTLISAILDGTRDTTDVRLGSVNVQGAVDIELKYGAYDDLLEAIMQSSWQAGATIASTAVVVDATAKTITVTGQDVTSDIAVGDTICLPSLTGYNIGGHRVTAINFSTDTVITIGAARTADTSTNEDGIADESGTSAINVNDTLKIGTTIKNVAILVKYDDIEGGPKYDLTLDGQFTNISLSVGVNALVTGSMNVIGRTYSNDFTLPVGTTFESNFESSFSGIDGSVSKDGELLRFAQTADITFEGNGTAMYELGSNYNFGVSYTKLTSSINISTFFTDYTLENQLLSETEASYDISCRLDHKMLSFSFPKCLITEAPKDVTTGYVGISGVLTPFKGDGDSSLIIRRVSNA